MGRHSADAAGASAEDRPQPDAFDDYDTASVGRVVAPTPPGFRRRVAVAVGVALLGVILLAFGIISLTNTTEDPSTNSQETDAVTQPPAATTAVSTRPALTTSTVPTAPAVLPVTVLNNSPVEGLAARVAEVLEAGGWPIAELLNYDETQAEATTVYFTPGNAAEETAAQALIAQFPEITGGAEPRFEGLAGSGLTVAAVGDWLP